MRWWAAYGLGSMLCVLSCAEPDASSSGTWTVELGIVDQSIRLADLDGSNRRDWLAASPRVVVSAEGSSVAVPFVVDRQNRRRVRLQGLFGTRELVLRTYTYEPGSSVGLDHNLSWSVRIQNDDGPLFTTTVLADIRGEPGCGGQPQPQAVTVFDAERIPLPWDEGEITVGGVRIAVVIPDHQCARRD